MTWIAPTVTPLATIAVAITFWPADSVARLGSKRSSSTARVTIVVRLPLGHVAHEAAANRHLGTDEPVAPAADRDPAPEHVAVGDPDGPALRAEGRDHPVEDLGQQLVEVERRAQLQSDGPQQAQTLDFLAELVGRRGGSAHLSDDENG